MGSVKVTVHPPLLVAPLDVDRVEPDRFRCVPHAALWLSVVVEEWHVRRSGHLHLVREGEGEWREVDLTRHPLRAAAVADESVADPEEMVTELRRVLADRSLRLYRIPDIGLASEIGEGREDFRRRATGLLRPEVQRRIDSMTAGPRSRLPWRRRAREREEADAKARIAAEIAGLADAIETVEFEDLAEQVRRAEVGMLLVAPDVLLEAPRHRSLMI